MADNGSTVALLERHAYGPHAESNPRPDANMDDADASIPALIRELFSRAREARRQQLPQWRSNYRALHNRDYKPGATPWDESPAVNQIFPVVSSACAWLTDQRPTIRVTPTAEANSEYWEFYNELAGDINVVISSAFSNYNLSREINRAWWSVHTYGIGYLKTVWEAPLADGLGDAAFRYVDAFTVYPDPYARNQQSLSYIGEIHQMTIEDADRAWPGAAKLLRDSPFFLEDVPEAPHRLDTETDPRRPRVALNKITGTDHTGQPITAQGTPGYHTRVGQHRNDIDSPVVTIMEFYVRDTISERTDGKIPDDSDTPEDESQRESVVKVRDDWRCIVVCGDVVLVNRPCSEIYAFPIHPYDRLVLTDTGEWYGPCITELLAPLQRTINWVLQSLIRNIHLAGNPQMIESPRSASGHHRFTNRPGQRIQATPRDVEWMNPPVLQGALATDLVSFLKGEIETISGLSAMVRGFSPQGRNAQGVIDSIQDAAFVRVRSSLREMEATLRNVASKMAAFIAEFYTEPRLMSIIGPDGRRTHRALRARHFYALDAEDRGKRIPLRFSLAADAGSSLPTSKQARAAESKHLFELGVIDEYEVLKTLEWPGAPDVTQRVMEAKSRAAMAEQQAGR